jgi:Predicted membrane protein (DUF2207) C-terminal domain/Predicted membrane protein (DUF2207) N-terminal domain
LLRWALQVGVLIVSTVANAAVPLNSFDTIIGVQRDGSAVVVEKFAPALPQAKVEWSTSTEYPGVWTVHQPRVVSILQVTTTEGRPLDYFARHGFTRLHVDIQTGGAREIRIVYAVRNAVNFRSDHDQLLWTAGEGWRGETAKASLFVQVPPESYSHFKAQSYLSSQGLLPMKPTEAGPDRIWFETPGRVGANDRLLADVIFQKGALQQPPPGRRVLWFVGSNLILLLPLATLLVMLGLRALKRLPAPETLTVVPRYEPPAEMTPAEVGVLLDDKLDPRDVTATLIDLAVRGYVRLERCKPDEGNEFEGKDFAIRSLRPKEDWRQLALHERTLLFHTFYGGEWTKLSSLRLRFYPVVPLIKRDVLQLLRRKGMYWAEPDRAQSMRLTMLIIFLVAAFAIQLSGAYSFASSWLLSLLAIGTSAAIVYYFGRTITSKTGRGIKTYHQVLGFQEFLNTVERDRWERLPSEVFEKWIPFAMALGVERHWADNFQGISIGQPDWMEGFDEVIFDSAGLARTLEGFARETRSSLLVMPRAFASFRMQIR